MENNIGWWLAKRAFLSPQREAYVGDDGARLTFAELNERCNRAANAFLDAGVRKGERVALLLMNSPEFVEAYFALAKIGAVVVPLNWRLVADELEFILKDSGAQRLIFDDEFVDTVADLHARGEKTDVNHWLQAGSGETAYFATAYAAFRDAASGAEPTIAARGEDMLYIMYTSGTTGLPKGVVHTHDTTIWGCITIAATTYFHDHDRFLSPLPMFHVGALTPLTLAVYRGITSIVMRSFDPVRAWELVDGERVTVGLAVPAMLNFMLQVPNLERFDHSQWRWCMSGAAPVPVSLMEACAKIGVEVHQIYGLTESCGPAALIDADNALKRIGSTGKAFFHTGVRIVRPDGSDCAANEPGEVLVAGPHIMREYWNRPEATAETIVDGLAAHRRRGAAGRGRLPLHRGPHQGHDHLRRRERLSGGDRERAAGASGHPRSRRDRPSEREVGRVAVRRGGQGGFGAHPERRAGVLPWPIGGLQAAEGRGLRGRGAAQPKRQDPQARPARAVSRAGACLSTLRPARLHRGPGRSRKIL